MRRTVKFILVLGAKLFFNKYLTNGQTDRYMERVEKLDKNIDPEELEVDC
jgi:hypothetical protein